MVLAGWSSSTSAQLLPQVPLFPQLQTNLVRPYTGLTSLHQERPTVLQSRLIAIALMEHDGATYKRTADSIRIYPRGLRSTELDFKDYFLTANGFHIAEPEMPYLPQATLIGGLPLFGDSLVTYMGNASGTAYDQLDYRSELSYNNDDKVTSRLEQEYTGGAWLNSAKTDYTYDAAGHITEVLFSTWSGGSWENYYRELYTYDVSGKLTEHIVLDWTGTDWENDSKIIYEYNGAGKCTTAIEQEGVGNTWVNDERSLLTYGSDGRVSEYVEQNWTGTWENGYKYYFTYNDNGAVITYIEQGWIAGAWENNVRRTHTYNGEQITLLLLESFDGTSWVNEVRANYVYNSSDVNTEIVLQEWNNGASSWENSAKILMAYNSYAQATEMAQLSWNPGEFWEANAGSVKYMMYYEVYDDGNGIAEQAAIAEMRVYPNPAKEQVHIAMPSIQASPVTFYVFDIQGRLCLQQSVAVFSGSTTLDISPLPAGSYMLQVNARTGTSSKAFQVVK